MKKQFYMAVAVIALLTVAGLSSANAQSQSSSQLKVNIPFAFNVGDQSLPAGEYTIRCTNPSSDMKVLELRSSNGRETVLIRTSSVSSKLQNGAKLVFNRYGAEYFFGQAWLPSDSLGMQAPKTRTEKQLARELAAHKLTRETVAVTAKR